MQSFVVTAMIMDVTVQNAIGEYGDGLMEQLAEAARSQATPSGTWLSKYGLPPRGVKYCKNETSWNEIVATMMAEGMEAEEAAMLANMYEGPYAACVQPIEAWGSTEPATIYQNAEPMFYSELFTAVLMLAFFFVETYDEEGELFLQALLVFSAPRQVRNATFCAIYILNALFYQDRHGTNIGTTQKRVAFRIGLGDLRRCCPVGPALF